MENRAINIYTCHKISIEMRMMTCLWVGNNQESATMHCDAEKAAYERPLRGDLLCVGEDPDAHSAESRTLVACG